MHIILTLTLISWGLLSLTYTHNIPNLIDQATITLDILKTQRTVYVPRVFNKYLYRLLKDLTDNELMFFIIATEQQKDPFLMNGAAAVIVDRLELMEDQDNFLGKVKESVDATSYAYIEKYRTLKKRKATTRACGDVEITIEDYVNENGIPILYLGSIAFLLFNNKDLTSLYGIQNLSFTDVVYIFLNNNCIEGSTIDPQFPTSPFKGFPNLGYLNINQNNIEAINSSFLDGVTLLSILDMGNNSLSTLPVDFFNNLDDLTTLSLSNNNISTASIPVSKLPSLQTLYLDGNSLTTIPSSYFQDNPNLIGLSFRNNALTTIPSALFDNLANLNYMDFANNLLLTFLPATLNDGSTVDLSGNLITELQQGIIEAAYPEVNFIF